MKMKQTIEQTGLTDRAIRLYISKGLVFPRINEKYNGRKEIEFSECDIERLSQIAALRKVGFSIPEIGEMIGNSNAIRPLAEQLATRAKAEAAEKSEAAAALSAALASGEPLDSLEALCAALTAYTLKTPLPEEDIKAAKEERDRKKYSVIICAVAAGLSILLLLGTPILVLCQYRFPYLDRSSRQILVLCCGWLVLTLALNSVLLFLLKRRTVLTKRFCRITNAVHAVTVLLFLTGLPSWLLCMGINPVESRTEDPRHYLQMDSFLTHNEWAESIPDIDTGLTFAETIAAVFPSDIPASACGENGLHYGFPPTTKYYYRYENGIDPVFDVFAEWRLPTGEYRTAKRAGSAGAVFRSEYGGWECYFFQQEHNGKTDPWDFLHTEWEHDDYLYVIFACNDSTQTVRYMASYAIDSLPAGPYFTQLNW